MSIIANIKRLFTRTLEVGECKMVLVVRSDISMTKGKTAAQCAHAALECYRETMHNTKKQQVFQSWLLSGQPKIVLKINGEKELLTLARNARKAGLIAALIKDAGKTQLTPGTISVLGIGPGPTSQIDKLTSDLKLL